MNHPILLDSIGEHMPLPPDTPTTAVKRFREPDVYAQLDPESCRKKGGMWHTERLTCMPRNEYQQNTTDTSFESEMGNLVTSFFTNVGNAVKEDPSKLFVAAPLPNYNDGCECEEYTRHNGELYYGCDPMIKPSAPWCYTKNPDTCKRAERDTQWEEVLFGGEDALNGGKGDPYHYCAPPTTDPVPNRWPATEKWLDPYYHPTTGTLKKDSNGKVIKRTDEEIQHVIKDNLQSLTAKDCLQIEERWNVPLLKNLKGKGKMLRFIERYVPILPSLKNKWTLKNPNKEDCTDLPACFEPLLERCATLWNVNNVDYRYYIGHSTNITSMDDWVLTWEQYQKEKNNPELRYIHNGNLVNE